MLYDTMQQSCKYGHYNLDRKAGYVLTEGDKLCAPWYYIYQNRKVLLYVDQNGPVKIQYQPPSGILLTKREIGETESKWQVWVSSPVINGGVPVSNFNSPWLKVDAVKPKMKIEWTPEKAIYSIDFKTADVVTEIFVPSDKATVCMKTTITNKSGQTAPFTVTPAIFPYVNVAQMVAWDLPEWYLSSKIYKNGNALTLHGQMRDPLMIKENERSVTINFNYEDDAECVLAMSDFAGTGNFFHPQSILEKINFTKMSDAEGMAFGSKQTVYSARYQCTLEHNQSKTFTQVMTVQTTTSFDEQENVFERSYFDDNAYKMHVADTIKFYDDLFSKRTVKTENPLYDNFINNFTPLQMYWVCSLDRGWPSSMRGTRDASQDFIGMLHLDPQWAKSVMLEFFEHQRTDGWFPRQISTISRQAPHDMRYFSDGGAFFLELFYEYMTFTRDFDFLDQTVWWLDSDQKSTVLEHIIKTVDYYLSPENIGEHGLCKVWYGDWWDVLDKIGMDGRGETVTVTAQNILNLKNLSILFIHLNKIGKVGDEYLALSDKYIKAREQFITAMRTSAYNKLGYFNGYFNDNGKWLFSDNDPDGEDRLYLVSNSWAIISGAADKQMADSVIDNIIKRNSCEHGFFTGSKGFPKYVDKAGRVGNGTRPKPGTYNHAQSFFVRACCVAGEPDKAYHATKYILPIAEDISPVEKTMAPPYAIPNMYNMQRQTCFQFLSGTVSYVLRTVYNFFFGLKYELDGLTISPCLPKEFGTCSVEFEFLGKNTITFKQGKDKCITFNGNKVGTKQAFIPDKAFKEHNIIEIIY